MGKFTTPLSVNLYRENPITGTCLWIVDEPLTFSSELTGKQYTVPTGFITDFASVPRVPIVYELFGATLHTASNNNMHYTPPVMHRIAFHYILCMNQSLK